MSTDASIKYTKLYSSQQMYSDHNKQDSSPQKEEEEQGQQEPKQEIHTPSTTNFPLYNEHDVYGMGYICRQPGSVVLAE